MNPKIQAIIDNFKTGQAVMLDWTDCKSEVGWTYSPTKPRTPGHIRSIGYIIQINKEAFVISTSVDTDIGASLDDISIPLGCINDAEALPDYWNVWGPEEEG